MRGTNTKLVHRNEQNKKKGFRKRSRLPYNQKNCLKYLYTSVIRRGAPDHQIW